jgi:hypothetical protein
MSLMALSLLDEASRDCRLIYEGNQRLAWRSSAKPTVQAVRADSVELPLCFSLSVACPSQCTLPTRNPDLTPTGS